MVKNTNLSTIESKKKQTKKTRRTDRIMDTESVLLLARWEGGVGERMGRSEGLRSTNR